MRVPRAAVLIVCLLISGCGSEVSGDDLVSQKNQYVQSPSDRDLFARDPQRQAARTVIVQSCSDSMKQGVETENITIPDVEVVSACECITDLRTRTLSTAQIEQGATGPDDGSCAKWLRPASVITSSKES